MKKILALTGAAFMAFSVSNAHADAGTSYFGAGINLWDISVDSPFGGGSADPRGIEGRYGYFFNDNFAVEGRLGLGVSDDLGIDIERSYGIYLKGVANTGGNFRPYGFLGYTDLTIDFDGFSESDNDLSFGFGATIGSGSTRFNVEWGRMYSDDADGASLDIDTLQIGIVSGF